MLDNKAAGIFIISLPQVITLSKLDPIILINSSIIRNYWIKFKIKEVLFLGTIQIDT
jgi:hypothetical protein